MCHKPLGRRRRYCSEECVEERRREARREHYRANRDAILAKQRGEWAAAKDAADAYMRSVKLAAPGSDPQQIAQIATTLDGPLPG